MTDTLIAIILAYLIGSLPFAVIVSFALRLPDPRTYGSNNPGATNVLRSGNKVAALLTLAGDGAKGWFAIWLFGRFAGDYGLGATALALVAFAVFIGHVFPVWLGFKGGKGVATASGVLLGLDARLALLTIVVWLAVVIATRYSSLGALVCAAIAPFGAWWLLGASPPTVAVLAISVVLVWRHQANIGKLLRGEESKVGARKAAAAAPAEEAR